MHHAAHDSALDERLLARLAQGDEAALESLLEQHWNALIDYAHGLLHSDDGAKDVVQEAFIRLWERRGDWRTGGARPILFRIVRNLALDQQRGASVRVRGAAAIRAAATPVAAVAQHSIEEQELSAAIAVALRALSDREREVVVLSRFHGLTRAQIAEVLTLAPQTVSNLLSVALARLWRALAPYLDDDQAAGIRRRSFQRH